MTPSDEAINKMNARHTAKVHALCAELGYGFVIQQAIRLWKEKDPAGAIDPGAIDKKWTKKGGHVLLGWQVAGKDVPLLRAGYDTKLGVWWAVLEAEREEPTPQGKPGTFRGVTSQTKLGEGLDAALAHIITALVSRARLRPWAEVAAPDVCGRCGKKATDLEPRRMRFVPGILSAPGGGEKHVPDKIVWSCGECRKGPAE